MTQQQSKTAQATKSILAPQVLTRDQLKSVAGGAKKKQGTSLDTLPQFAQIGNG